MALILPKIAYVYNRRKTASAKKKASVELRITYQGKQKYISSGVSLYPKQWRNGTIVNCVDANQISKILETLLVQVRQVLLEMIQENNIDIFDVPARIEKLHKEKPSFIAFCEQRAEVRKYGKTADSQERYNRFIKLFSQWGKIKTFKDIKETTIIAYDKYLISLGMKPYSKWNNYHRFLNGFIMDAIDAGYLQKNPYKSINIEKEKNTGGISKYLSPEEFQKLKTAEMSSDRLTKVRDLFVFQTYTCLSYTDLRDFDYNAIQEIKGMKVYTGVRRKTNQTFTIPLLPGAIEILEKYNYQLPLISNVKYNEYIKEAAKEAQVNKAISTHWARHTGATLLLNNGVDMQIVSKVCGHSSIKMTEQIYAKLLDETVVDAISGLNKY